MSAIFGMAGEGADDGGLMAMAGRLAHRGRMSYLWAPEPDVHLGVRYDAKEPGENAADLVAWDGAIDNAHQVELLLGGSRGAPRPSAAQLVLELLEQHGRAGLNQLDGPFAVAIWERATRTLLLARDRNGFRPLFYTFVRGHLVFASEYCALLALDEVPATPNREAIQRVQRTKYTARDETCLADVLPVPPGEWVAFRNGEIRRQRYWDLPARSVVARSEPEHARAVESTFVDVMAAETAAHDPIGVALSGDLDSTAMLAAIRARAPARTIHTFTAGYGPEDRQLVRARAVAEHYDSCHHEIVMTPSQLPSLLPELVWHMGDPIGREEYAYMFLLGREARRYVSNIFLGHGLDLFFGGMPKHLLAHLAFRHPLVRHQLADFYNYTQTGEVAGTWGGRLLVAAYFRGSQSRPPRVLGANDPPQLASLEPAAEQPLTEYLGRSLLGHRGRAGEEHVFAASGLGFFAPMTALPLLAVAQGIPDQLKIRGLEQKHVFRRACDRLVPDHLRRKKKGLQKLQHDRELSDVLDSLADELLSPNDVVRRGLFAQAEVQRIRQRAGTRPHPTERLYRLWTLLLTELWGRSYLDNRGRGPAR